MQLMNISDFERVLTHWQVNPEDPNGPTFSTPPGMCWIRGYDDFPSIAELWEIMFMDNIHEYDSDISLPELEEKVSESDSVAGELTLALKQNAVTGIVAEREPDRDGAWGIACDRDWRTGLYCYLLHAKEGNLVFRDIASARDIARNIFLAQVVRENVMHDAFASDPDGRDYSWNYRIAQAGSPEELQKHIADLGHLRGKTSAAWFLCTHVVNEILSVAAFVMAEEQLVERVVFYEPAPEGCSHMDPSVMLFWRAKLESEPFI